MLWVLPNQLTKTFVDLLKLNFKMKQFFTFLFFFAFTLSVQAQKKKKDNGLKPIDSLTKEMVVKKGLITTYLDEENKLFFELSQEILKKELLVVTRFAQLPANYSAYLNAGSKTAQQVIRFEKKGKKILIKQVSYKILPASISFERETKTAIRLVELIKNAVV